MADDEIADVETAWQRIERWYAERAPQQLADLGPPASRAALDALAATTGIVLPGDVERSLSRHDGSGLIHGLDYLDAGWAAQVWERMQMRMARGDFEGLEPADDSGARFAAIWWSPKWLPVAEHRGGTLICVDTAPGPEGRPGQILRLEPDDEGPGPTDWASFAAWLDAYRRDLEDGRYAPDEDGNLDRIGE